MKQRTADQDRQIKFVRSLAINISDEMIQLIEADRVPAAWDGHELRQWLQGRCTDANYGACMKNKRAKRYRDYRNDVIVNSL